MSNDSVSIAPARRDVGAAERAPHSGKPPFKDMVWIPGGDVPDGLERPLPGGGAGPPRAASTASGSTRYAGHQRPVPPLRRGDRLRHVAERAPDAADYPGAKPEMLVPGSVVFKQPARARRPEQSLQLVGLDARRRLAPPGGAEQLARGARAPSGRPRRLGGRRGVRRLGRQGAADRGRVGVRRPRRAGRRRVCLGRRVRPGRASRWPTPGRASSPGRT